MYANQNDYIICNVGYNLVPAKDTYK